MEKLKSSKELLDFINNAGFSLYVGIKDIKLVNIWDITENPSWEENLCPWLDEIIISKKAIYPLIIKNRAGIVSKEFFKYFYRIQSEMLDLLNNRPEDYFERGELSKEALKILNQLENGPLGVKELRKVSGTNGKEGKSLFDKTMLTLKKAFAIVKVDVCSAGWGENVFALTHNVFRDDVIGAAKLDKLECYKKIIYRYMEMHGETESALLARIFSFNKQMTDSALEQLVSENSIKVNSCINEKNKKCELFYIGG